MRIVNSLVEDFGDFELDTSVVQLHSESSENIMLPYSGALPDKMLPATNALLQVNVQPIQGAGLVLVVERNGKEFRRPLDGSNQEVIDLLDRFFDQNMKDMGLMPYWIGFWQANYKEWRQVATNFRRLMKPLMALPTQERTYIANRLLK